MSIQTRKDEDDMLSLILGVGLFFATIQILLWVAALVDKS